MATVRQYDGDNAIERWRHCDDTTATVRYDYRIVAPLDYQCQQKCIVCIRYSAGTRQFVTGAGLDDYLVGDFFHLRLRRLFPGFLEKESILLALARKFASQ
ncbi:hypothetical protein DPMN_065022, partial [Dreissena polymorpha]